MASAVFRAQWTGGVADLAPKILTREERVSKIAWDVFSVLCPIIGLWRLVEYAIGCVASWVILPATDIFNREKLQQIETRMETALSEVKNQFQFRREFIETPDGARLEVLMLESIEALEEKDSPVVICFNPNAALAQQVLEQPLSIYKHLILSTPCRIVCFNYRGTGRSSGSWNRFDDLVVDGASVVQWVRSKLGVSPDKIQFYGCSLGGAVAAKVQALDPELTGLHINDRSFSSVAAILQASMGFYFGSFLSGILDRQGYGIYVEQALARIQNKIVWHHPQDQIIPKQARHEGSEPLAPHSALPKWFYECRHNVPLLGCSDEIHTRFATIFGPQPGSAAGGILGWF